MASELGMYSKAAFRRTAVFAFTQVDIFNALERMAACAQDYDGDVPGGNDGPSDLNFALTAAGALPVGDPRVQM